jgi:hypothetical protein
MSCHNFYCVCVYLHMYVTYKHFLYSLLPDTQLLLPSSTSEGFQNKTYHISLNVKRALFTVFTLQENTYTDHPSICRNQGNTQFFRCQITRICSSTIYMGTAVAQWLRYCATNRKSLVRFQMVSLEFFIHIIIPIALWPCG